MLAKLCAALALLAATPALAQPLTSPSAAGLPKPEDGYFQQRYRLAQGVWLLAQPKFVVQPAGNVGIVEQADGVVLIDAGGSPGAGRRVVAEVRALTNKPVKAVIVTHWHGDHPQGLSEILKAWPDARTIATQATQAHLSNPKTMNTPAAPDAAKNEAFLKQVRGFVDFTRGQGEAARTAPEKQGWAASERLFNQYLLDMDGALTVPTREGFSERLDIADARAPVEASFLGRGNTDGDAVIWLPKQRVLFSGDLVVSPIPFGFGSYPADWIATLEELKAYPFATLAPGHGPPQTDRAYIDRLIALISTVRAQVGPLAKEGLTLEAVRKRVDLSKEARAFAGDDPWLTRWFVQYWTDPFVASAYKEAKGEPIVQGLGG